MHCLYCDRPLALLKRLTGDGEFCSKEHRKIYQQEHNQLALERLLETQPASNKKPTARKPRNDTPIEVPIIPVAPPAEPGPEPAGFVDSYPSEAAVVFGSRQLAGDPRFPVNVAPDWKVTLGEGGNAAAPGPKGAAFQPEFVDPRAFAASVRIPGQFGFKFAPGMPSRAVFTVQGEPTFRPEKFVNGFLTAQAIPGLCRRVASEPVWRSFEPSIPSRLDGGIVLVTGSFLRWGVVPAAAPDVSPEAFEIQLQSVSFPPFPPRMACLEERLHRTDRIGFSPP